MARKGSGTFTSAEKKSEKSSSGLGLSIGLGTVGDIEIKGIVDVDISPLSGDINYDASENDLSVDGEIGLPGNTVSIGGGVTVDLDTGSISGGSASLGFGGGEVEVSISECEQTLQVTYWGAGFAVSKNNCDDGEENDENDDISQPPPTPNPGIDPSGIPGISGYIVYAKHDIFFYSKREEMNKPTEISQTAFTISAKLPGIYVRENNYTKSLISLKTTVITRTQGGGGNNFSTYSIMQSGFPPSLFDFVKSKYAESRNWLEPGLYSSSFTQNLYGSDPSNVPVTLVYTNDMKRYVEFIYSWLNQQGNTGVIETKESKSNIYYNNDIIGSIYGINHYHWFDFLGYIPVGNSDAFNGNNSKNRRPLLLGEGENMGECCDVSISLLRKIAKVLAVDELLAPFQTSGKILKEAEKGIDKILEDPDQVIEINNYIALNTILSLLSNRKVALAVGADELEFEKDEKKPEFHYLRWLKEYSEGLTSLSYQEWIESKNKEEGLKASKTQFKSIPQLMLAELYNSKTTNDVLRAHDLMKRGMEIPNELLVPGGLGFSVVYDYPNIFKKLIQMIDLSTIQPFTAILQDADPAKEGNQPLTRYYPDATSAVKEIIELLLENKVDSATRLNILMRQSILNTQQQIALLETLSIAYTIMYGLGLPFHQKGSHFIAPFDVSPKTDNTTDTKGKGFNPKNKKEEEATQSAINSLNENNENSTEKMLPDFLKTVKQEYLHTYFDDSKESLWYYVMSVFMKI